MNGMCFVKAEGSMATTSTTSTTSPTLNALAPPAVPSPAPARVLRGVAAQEAHFVVLPRGAVVRACPGCPAPVADHLVGPPRTSRCPPRTLAADQERRCSGTGPCGGSCRWFGPFDRRRGRPALVVRALRRGEDDEALRRCRSSRPRFEQSSPRSGTNSVDVVADRLDRREGRRAVGLRICAVFRQVSARRGRRAGRSARRSIDWNVGRGGAELLGPLERRRADLERVGERRRGGPQRAHAGPELGNSALRVRQERPGPRERPRRGVERGRPAADRLLQRRRDGGERGERRVEVAQSEAWVSATGATIRAVRPSAWTVRDSCVRGSDRFCMTGTRFRAAG